MLQNKNNFLVLKTVGAMTIELELTRFEASKY